MANDFSARQPRRKYCQFCKENTEFIDYKDTQLLRKYMTCLLYTSDAADD